MTFEPVTVGAEKHRARGALTDREVDGAGDARGERHGDGLAAFAQNRQHAVTAFEVEVVDIGADRLRDSQPVQREQRDEGVIAWRRQASGDEDGTDLVAVKTHHMRLVVDPGLLVAGFREIQVFRRDLGADFEFT